MKLTDKELELLTNIESRRRARKLGAWIALIGAVALVLVTAKFGWLPSLTGSGVPAVLLGAAAAHLAWVYSSARPEDRLMELLQRYVNQDPDAVQQLGR